MSLWGGRFSGEMSDATRRFTFDTSDRRLLEVDIRGSIAHVTMLASTGIISETESKSLVDGLEQLLADTDGFPFSDADEDVHSAVERRLGEIVGDVAAKLHTGRSRNDQVALDLRLYLTESVAHRVDQLRRLVTVLADLAESHVSTIIPSYTHLQQAQVTTLGHHLLAYAWMALRSADRFTDARARIALSPLGAGASSGSSLPLDREITSDLLGLEAPIPNSLDAVGSRDFVAEYVFCCAQTMVELSRLAEEIVLWSTREFAWLTLGDTVSTGSSALPQKRNPDIAELIRGRAATVSGDMAAILSLQKGLPLAYNRDLQEDKRICFHADDAVAGAIDALAALLADVEFHPPAPSPETVALDLAEALVVRGVAFREAHSIIGRLVQRSEQESRGLDAMSLVDLQEVDPRFAQADLELLDPSVSLGRRLTSGSGSPDSVRHQVSAIRARLDSGS